MISTNGFRTGWGEKLQAGIRPVIETARRRAPHPATGGRAITLDPRLLENLVSYQSGRRVPYRLANHTM
jgi:hypothetical protein